jgi:hypothetical protein
VTFPSGNGKSRVGKGTTSRVVRRFHLLDGLIEASHSADRSRADRVLVEANRWLRKHPFDVRVAEARDRVRLAHPADRDDALEAPEA